MILEQFNLAGKVAIVTGASSARLQETVEKIKALGRRCLGIQADLIDTKVIPQIVDATLKEYGRIDILINCAGIIRRAPAILARIPAGRWGTPEDMKGLAVFLASDAAEYLQGQVIAVDGGWLGR